MKVIASKVGRFVEVALIEDLLAEASEMSYELYSQILHEILVFTPASDLKKIYDSYEEKVYGEEDYE